MDCDVSSAAFSGTSRPWTSADFEHAHACLAESGVGDNSQGYAGKARTSCLSLENWTNEPCMDCLPSSTATLPWPPKAQDGRQGADSQLTSQSGKHVKRAEHDVAQVNQSVIPRPLERSGRWSKHRFQRGPSPKGGGGATEGSACYLYIIDWAVQMDSGSTL